MYFISSVLRIPEYTLIVPSKNKLPETFKAYRRVPLAANYISIGNTGIKKFCCNITVYLVHDFSMFLGTEVFF